MLLVLVVVVASVIASFTDWVFMDVMVRAQYAAAPDVWRAGFSETWRVVWSQLLGFGSSATLTWLYVLTQPADLAEAARLATIVWLAAVAPITLQNVLWMRLHPVVGLSHAIGWLVRFLITMQVAVWLAPHA
jgi:heme/copper-type cytochrome/quinol oxidase subunit 4